MKKPHTIEIPESIKTNLGIRFLLSEKTKPELSGLNFCCYINNIAVYTDSYMERNKVMFNREVSSYNVKHGTIDLSNQNKLFLIVGFCQEEVKYDSYILQILALVLKNQTD